MFPRTIYRIRTKIAKIEESFIKIWRDGYGDSARFDTISRGWYVHFEGSSESLSLGREKPPWEEGDEILISIEKVPDANPK